MNSWIKLTVLRLKCIELSQVKQSDNSGYIGFFAVYHVCNNAFKCTDISDTNCNCSGTFMLHSFSETS